MTVVNKYNKRARKIKSLVCVGLDSDFNKLPAKFKRKRHPQFEFNKWIIEQTHPYVTAYKPNIAFYEARGARGLEDLKLTMDYLRKNYADIFTICDAKRADIGNTNNGYVTEVFDWFGFDAITVHPYLGAEALEPFLSRKDKGVIILCRTSNPGSGELQDLEVQPLSKPLWWVVASRVAKKWNRNNNCMIVAGATYPKELKQIRRLAPEMTLLVPAVGAQGGSVKTVVTSGINADGLGLIINSSRGIIFSEKPAIEAQKLRDEINIYRDMI